PVAAEAAFAVSAGATGLTAAAEPAAAAPFTHRRLETLALFRRHLRHALFPALLALLRCHVRIESATSAAAAAPKAFAALAAVAARLRLRSRLGRPARTFAATVPAAARAAI